MTDRDQFPVCDSPIDDRLRRRMRQLAEHVEAQLPPGIATMFWFYNKTGRHLDLNMCSNEDTAGTLRILRASIMVLLRQDGGADPANETWYQADDGPGSNHLVSSASVTRTGNHDRVRIWNRGGLAGELVVAAGDGASIALGFGLEPRP